MDSDYERYGEARFFWRTVTAVWGLTHIGLAAVIVIIVRSSTTANVLTFNRTVPWVLTGVLLVWAYWWGERLRAQKPEDDD